MDLDNGSDIVLASSLSIARNISGIKFTSTYSAEDKAGILQRLLETADRLGFKSKAVAAMEQAEKTWLVEEELVSKGFMLDAGNCIIRDAVHDVFVIVCDENHLTIKKKTDALDVQVLYNDCSNIASRIASYLEYAYDEDFGYLSTNIDELGTGMSFSFLVHLPAMAFSGELNTMFRQILETGCEITSKSVSAFGPNGAFFTIKLPVIPREHEQYFLDRIEPAMKTLVTRERVIRKTICEYQYAAVLDRIGRSFGIARYAYDLSHEEFTSVVSDLRMGRLLDIVQFPDTRMFDRYALHDPIHESGFQNVPHEESEAQYRAKLMKKITECITFNER